MISKPKKNHFLMYYEQLILVEILLDLNAFGSLKICPKKRGDNSPTSSNYHLRTTLTFIFRHNFLNLAVAPSNHLSQSIKSNYNYNALV